MQFKFIIPKLRSPRWIFKVFFAILFIVLGLTIFLKITNRYENFVVFAQPTDSGDETPPSTGDDSSGNNPPPGTGGDNNPGNNPPPGTGGDNNPGNNPPPAEPPPATGPGGQDPGGTPEENCVCNTQVVNDASCTLSGKRVVKTCTNCSGSSICAEDLGAAPLWVQVVSVESDGSRISWKGSQYEDIVKVDTSDALQDWSYPGTGGGIDDEGYFKYYRPYYTDALYNKTWEFDKNTNRIDASGTMNLWIPDGLGNEEFWSNHFCGNGRGWSLTDNQKPPYPPANTYQNQIVNGNDYNGRNVSAYFDSKYNAISYCRIDQNSTTPYYCTPDYDGCIYAFSGGKTCVGDYCNSGGYHAFLNEHIGDFNWINWVRDGSPAWGLQWINSSPGLRYQGRWSATFQIYGDTQNPRFDVNLRAPLGYLCRIADARRIQDNSCSGCSGEMETEQNSGNFIESGRDQPRCTWHVEQFADGAGHGIAMTFLITKDPNFNIAGWYKVRDGSFYKKGNIDVIYPSIVNPYDSDDNGKIYPVLDFDNAVNPGLTTLTGDTLIASGNIDGQLTTDKKGKVSATNWRINNYTADTPFLSNLRNFLSTLQGQASTITITNIGQIQENKVNIIDIADFTINTPLPSNKRNYILFVKGNLTLDAAAGNIIGSTANSIALIAAESININSNIREINAILIADRFNLAYPSGSSTNALKVNGNLISNDLVETWRRDRSDYDKPSVFVVFKPNMYFDLLKLLSSSTLSGRQVQ